MPEIKIYINKIVDNFHKIHSLCQENGKELMVITKCVKSNPKIVSELIKNGAKSIGDTSAVNLVNIKSGTDKMLMKVSSNIEKFSDKDFNILYLSDMKILRHVAKSAEDKTVNIILPIEMGELREGIPQEEIIEFMKEAVKLENVNIKGISGNFGCMAGLYPDSEKFNVLSEIADEVKEKLGFELEIVSVGGTVVYDCLLKGEIPKKINHIRMGEGIFTGQNTSSNNVLNGFHVDTFILSGEILELNTKNTFVKGKYGYNAFGDRLDNNSRLVNRGKRKRAVIDLGFMKGRNENLKSLDNGIEIVGNSFDFTVVDLENSSKDYCVGDKIDFLVDYGILSYAMLSSEIKKIYIK